MPTGGFVLAGGASRRMRQDKALLDFHGQPLIESIAQTVEAVIGSVVIIGDPDRYRSLNRRVIPDHRTNCGPLAGIETGLMQSEVERNLFVACDMPGLTPDLLQRLLDSRPAPCVLPKTPDGRRHPLCAIWDRSLLPAVQASLDGGRLRVFDPLQDIDIEEVYWQDLSNTNTPEEWRALLLKSKPSTGA